MKRLIVFGDSMSYGVGLEDCWPNTSKPSRYCWPELAASALGRKCINKSVPGASNKRIWFSIDRFKFRSDDLVLILWTYPDRTAILKNPFNVINLLPSLVGKSQSQVEELSRNYYENLHAFYDSQIMTELYIRDATNKLEKLNLNFYQMIADPAHKEFFNDISYIPLYMKYYECNYNKALDGDHAGYDGHLAFAKDLLDYMGAESDIEKPRFLSFFEKIKRKCR